MPYHTNLSFKSELTSKVPKGVYGEYIIPSKPFIGAKISVLGPKMSFSPYLRSAMVQFKQVFIEKKVRKY